jgi:hypothetical protein
VVESIIDNIDITMFICVLLQLFLFKEIILMIYIFKYEDYEKQTNFLRNTRMVMING